MNSTTIAPTISVPPGAPRAARIGIRLLSKLQGRLVMELPDGQTLQLGNPQGAPDQAPVSIKLHNWAVFAASLRNGDIGFAESYIRGDWTTDSLTRTLTLLASNRQVLEKAVYGNWFGRLAHRLSHLLNRNTRRGARRNIHAHYDLGNAFYAQWLDQSMTYSSALFSEDASSLEQAQQAKYQRILDQAGARSDQIILEVGCGWGGLADIAAHQGLRVRGLTLSDEQLNYGRARIKRAGLEQQVTLALQDYRDERGQYDAIVSIEMFEAVGKEYWSGYFEMIRRCLKRDARAVVQTITIADELFERYERGSDFIQQYIFPGGMLPSPARFEQAAAQHGLIVTNRHAFGADYAKTLASWHQQFEAHAGRIGTLGFDEHFMRTWRFYLAYCEAAFKCGNTDVYQFTLEHGHRS